jgi:(1->4)-alpha-D-glucan 1-alpha-D-glucosylmutase
MQKAIREARVHTTWNNPDARYERALRRFIHSITKPGAENTFLQDFLRLHQDIAYYGAINSLAQLLLKITMPGVPDFYQGSELWDFRLVDPDNRGPIDFAARVRLLNELQQQEKEWGRLELTRNLLENWQDGRIKLFVTSTALNFRRSQEHVFLEGEYQPLAATGAKRHHAFAFARRAGNAWVLTAVPRLVTKLGPAGRAPVGAEAWGASALVLPREAPADWLDVLTGEKVSASRAQQKLALPLAEVFGKFPIALFSAG